jgi:hypothetical protein
MLCLALLTYLGGIPDGVLEIPRSTLNQYTPAQINRAKACARQYGIKWRIVER